MTRKALDAMDLRLPFIAQFGNSVNAKAVFRGPTGTPAPPGVPLECAETCVHHALTRILLRDPKHLDEAPGDECPVKPFQRREILK